MHWNYRVIKHKDGLFGVHEVYYDEKGKPMFRSDRTTSLEHFEEAGDIQDVIELMYKDIKGAESLDILDDEVFEKK